MSPTRTKVIIINGKPQSGKDTFVKFATDYCNMDESANVLNLSSVDLIKGMLYEFGWDGEKTDEVRSIIAGIKQIWINAQNGPTMFMVNNIMQYHMAHVGEDNIIFCHIREPEEIIKLKKIISGMDAIGIEVKTLLIERDNAPIVEKCCSSDDARNIVMYDYDFIVYNGGEDLAKYDEIVCKFIDKLLE